MVSRVLICTGKYANEPYHLEKVCVNVYCVEELCYLFANNPFMINTEIMDKHLPEWLREQCGLPELADRLTLAMKKGIQAGANVVMPNLSPVAVREKYKLYDNKICTGDEAAECRHCMARRMESVGYKVVVNRGDYH